MSILLQCLSISKLLSNKFIFNNFRFPPQLKSVCHCLYQVVSQRFHESGTGALASAIFLRFLNPSIATPYDNGLCEKPLPPNLARAFKFMCKVIVGESKQCKLSLCINVYLFEIWASFRSIEGMFFAWVTVNDLKMGSVVDESPND